MRQLWRYLREKLHIVSWQALAHLLLVEVVLNIVWDRVSVMFQTVAVREIGFLVIFVSVIFAVAWYLPKLSPALYSFGIGAGARKSAKPVNTRLTYDNVLWEDAGSDGWGGIRVTGPFCPKDFTPLATKRGWDKIVDTNLREEDYYSDRSEHLFCLECNAEYVLSNNPKRLEQSRSEVRTLFNGIRRRKQLRSED